MFLAELQLEEKIAFLELAALIAKIDGNLSIYESPIINKYKKEMGLENYKIKGLVIDKILGLFRSERAKNIVLTEIFRLIFSDGVFSEAEKESVRLIKKHFGFDSNEFENLKDWIGKIKELSIPR
ncbi:hypothetical protein [Bacillus sp. T33-2]|uniref:hypothetical protein n=1 Tax=Bacillus sp. T33-2 TaxID=2054168 RepID=UPI000C75696A|nr:hypothetical protein [Bacillus sp. T33-2]PLR95280.1 hypothetical protein CVD19_15035 [Bacillus sp. T33-2]